MICYANTISKIMCILYPSVEVIRYRVAGSDYGALPRSSSVPQSYHGISAEAAPETVAG